MVEVAGYERMSPIGEIFDPDMFAPPVPPSAGPAIVASAFFPAGNWNVAGGNPNQVVRWGTYAATTGSQGGGLTVPCIPGRQYTASVYATQGDSNTIQGAITDLTLGDQFQRVTASGWGTADAGGAWSVTGGAASDYSTAPASTGGAGIHTHTSVNVARQTYIGAQIIDSSQVITVSTPVLATGAAIVAGLTSRFVDANNYYRCLLTFNIDQTISFEITRRVGAVTSTLLTYVTTLTHVAGTKYSMRFETTATTLRARAWLAGAAEPTTWQASTTDTSLTTAASLGTFSRLNGGNTNTLPVPISFYNYLTSYAVQVSTTTANLPLEWDRFAVTFTATQPTHTFAVQTISTASTTPTVMALDNAQLEQAASASAFSTTGGSVIYPIMRNFIERWPRKWSSAGREGYVEAPCVDGFGAVNAIAFQTEYREAILTLSPDYYWPLSDPAGSLVYVPINSTVANQLLVNTYSKYGAGTLPVAGTAAGIVGDPGGTGVKMVVGTPAGTFEQAMTIIGCGAQSTVAGFPFPPVIGTAWAASVSIWVTGASTPGFPATLLGCFDNYLTNPPPGVVAYTPLLIWLTSGLTPGRPQFQIYNYAAGTTYFATAGSAVASIYDGLPHLIVATVEQTNGANTILTLYLDGVLVDTVTVTTASLGGMLGGPGKTFQIGGTIDPYGSAETVNATVSHVALWTRVLSATEVADLWRAGSTGYSGETSGARITRHLARGGYTGSTRISTGQSTMEAPTWTGAINLLTDSQDTTVAEQGTLWMAPDGAFVFESRNDRFLRLTSKYTLGENQAGGEYPYLEDVEFDFDPNFVYADVRVTRNGGGTAVGGLAPDIIAAEKRYFPRSFQANMDVQTDTQAQDTADWIFNTHKAASLRVASITLDPAANLALWSVALGFEIGMRITVIRRAAAANNGAGLTVQGDFFVEQITHDNVNMAAGTWTTTLYVSPIGAAPGVTFQPWILENATYGVLDSTTVLAF